MIFGVIRPQRKSLLAEGVPTRYHPKGHLARMLRAIPWSALSVTWRHFAKLQLPMFFPSVSLSTNICHFIQSSGGEQRRFRPEAIAKLTLTLENASLWRLPAPAIALCSLLRNMDNCSDYGRDGKLPCGIDIRGLQRPGPVLSVSAGAWAV